MGAPFLWSWSRHRQLEHCPRQYWYSYYGARGGWRADAPAQARELFRLKRLVGRSQWLGQLAHEAVADVLRGLVSGEAVDEPALRARVLAHAETAIAVARGASPPPPEGPPVGFEELDYGVDPGDAAWAQTIEDLATRIDDLLAHPVLMRLREVPERMIEVDRLRKVWLDGIGLYVAPDVLVDDGRGGRVIIDWKTGRGHDPDVVAQQMAVYAWWVCHDERLPPSRVAGVQANVPGDAHITVRFDGAQVDGIVALVRDSVERMAAYLPQPRRDQAPFEAFDPRPEGDPQCAGCRFRRPCGRAAEADS